MNKASTERKHKKQKSNPLLKAINTKQKINKKYSKIAKEFYKYLTSVDTALANKIPIVTKDLCKYLP